jgi:hypothetical protein
MYLKAILTRSWGWRRVWGVWLLTVVKHHIYDHQLLHFYTRNIQPW